MLTGTRTTDKSYKTLTLNDINRVMSELKAVRKAHPLPVIMFHSIDDISILKGKLVDLYLQCKEDEVGMLIPIKYKIDLEKLRVKTLPQHRTLSRSYIFKFDSKYDSR